MLGEPSWTCDSAPGASMDAVKQDLLTELAWEESYLAELESRREAVRSRMGVLRAKLMALSAEEPTQAAAMSVALDAQATPADKVRLFRALFRGCEDIFPTRFTSKKTGKSGYAPACANKFVRGVCDLPQVKCSECPNQAFTLVDDRVVLDHLRGRHVMGVYPLLEDET